MPDIATWWARSRRTILLYTLALVGLIVLGTVAVLSTVRAYFGIYPQDLILPSEVDTFRSWAGQGAGGNATGAEGRFGEKVPRIIHQTWKTETLPDPWIPVRETCEALHPTAKGSQGGGDKTWRYMLWTNELSRDFIAREYAWFLPTFDGYKYDIQRADAIRYFVLHYYGGVYMDLDIGCQKPMDPFLYFDVILPVTIPVGVSNDLMFTSPRHPFMELVIHNLMAFDHNYGTNYPTVMFSTGPMALSAIYGLWRRTHPDTLGSLPVVRILPQLLYGKNSPPELASQAYFTHYYGSSWHTDDSGFILWLGRSGKMVLYLGMIVVVVGLVREIAVRRRGVGGKWRRAAAGVISPRMPTAGGPVSSHGLPYALEGWVTGEGRFRRLRRGDLFFLPAYWMGDSRPGSPSATSSPAAPNGGWASFLPSFIYDPIPNGGGRYRALARTTMDAQGEEAVALRGLGGRGKRGMRRGWHSASQSGSDDDADVLPQHYTRREGSDGEPYDDEPGGSGGEEPLPGYSPTPPVIRRLSNSGSATRTGSPLLKAVVARFGEHFTSKEKDASPVRVEVEDAEAEGFGEDIEAGAGQRPRRRRSGSGGGDEDVEDETDAFLAAVEREDRERGSSPSRGSSPGR